MPDAGMLDAGAGCRMPGMSKTLIYVKMSNPYFKAKWVYNVIYRLFV